MYTLPKMLAANKMSEMKERFSLSSPLPRSLPNIVPSLIALKEVMVRFSLMITLSYLKLFFSIVLPSSFAVD